MSGMPLNEYPAKRGSARKTPPALRLLNPLSSTFAFQRDPLHFLSMLAEQYGDIVRFRLLNMPIIFINHPDYLKQVLLDNQANYDKNVFLFNVARPFLGNGLLTNVGGKSWLRQRRLMQPAFHRQRIAPFGKLMTDTTLEMLRQWEMSVAQNHSLDVAEEMTRLTLHIVGKALLSMDISDKSNAFGQAFAEIHKILAAYARFPFPPLSVPTLSHLRLWASIRKMDGIIAAILSKRRQHENDRGDDLLSMLLNAVDEETGETMSDQQLRDEIATLLVAGSETSANTLSWVWYLLSQHPEIEEQLHAELDTKLAGRVPTVDDLPQLSYTRMVIEETLRIYTPNWFFMRRACNEDEVGGYYIPANANILYSQYTLHRHPAFWEDPARFDPNRFLPERVAERSRYAYLPFSNGPRVCIGHHFAMMELQLILAIIAQRCRLVLVPEPPVEVMPLFVLRPRAGIHVQVHPR